MFQIIWRVSVSACLVQYLSKQRDRHYVGENISYSSKVFDPILFFKSSLKPGSECVTVEGLIEASVFGMRFGVISTTFEVHAGLVNAVHQVGV